VKVTQPEDGVLGDLRITREVRPLQVIVEVYVVHEGSYGGALFEEVEAEEARSEGRVSHVQADADPGMVDSGDLLGKLGRPDRVVVDLAA
jgi:hypothetical protein